MQHVAELLGAVCVCAALCLESVSYVLVRKLATPTPAYNKYMRDVRAQAATRPAGTISDYPEFSGKKFMLRPFFSLPTTYFALGFAGAAIALFVLCRSGFLR